MNLTRLLVISTIVYGIVPIVVADDIPSLSDKNVFLRGTLSNSRIQFEQKKMGHVAFIGGSITQMNGYRPMVTKRLQERFPKTEFTFTAAGISSTCSTTGAFRLATDVLKGRYVARTNGTSHLDLAAVEKAAGITNRAVCLNILNFFARVLVFPV